MSAILKGQVRDKLGSRWARRLRLQERIPCSIQGEGKNNLDISISVDEFLAARRHHEHLFDIEIEGGEAETVMVRELQWATLDRSIQHVEFRRVVRGQKTEAEVELEFVGRATGGTLNHLLTHVTVSCMPSDIPDSIEVKIEGLEVGHPLLLRDLKLPEGVEVVGDPEMAVCLISVVREEEETSEDEEEGLGLTEPPAAPESDS